MSGATKEDESVTGTITIPEVAHDTEQDEYVVRSSPPKTPTNQSLTLTFTRKPPPKKSSAR